MSSFLSTFRLINSRIVLDFFQVDSRSFSGGLACLACLAAFRSLCLHVPFLALLSALSTFELFSLSRQVSRLHVDFSPQTSEIGLSWPCTFLPSSCTSPDTFDDSSGNLGTQKASSFLPLSCLTPSTFPVQLPSLSFGLETRFPCDRPL
jgi:hypothetical protein